MVGKAGTYLGADCFEEVPVAAGDPSPADAPLTAQERTLRGRRTRERVPRTVHGEWAPAPDRPDPVELLARQEATRVPELVAVRHERMGASPFAFYRGAAIVFAADVASVPRTGLAVQACGDAHLANFGAYASPERNLVFDINDFDETLPGPFEWDLKRLAASFEVATRSNGFADRDRRAVVEAVTRSYCTSMSEFAAMSNIDLWYLKLDVVDVAARWGVDASKAMIKQFRRTVEKAESKDRLQAFAKLTTMDQGEPRFVSQPPLLDPIRELVGDEEYLEVMDLIKRALHAYRRTLQPDRRRLIDRYRFVDLARKVVGVGSVGTRCWVALFVGRDEDDPLFLQVKEAEASVLEPYLGRSTYAQHGQRVVEGQRLTQAATDILLGWTACRRRGRPGSITTTSANCGTRRGRRPSRSSSRRA